MFLKKSFWVFLLCGSLWGWLGSSPAQADVFCVDDLSDGFPVPGDCNEICHPTPTCSLRDAIEAANQDALSDQIIFGIDGSIILTGAEGNDDNSGGDLDILQSVQITGNGVVQTVVDGGGIDRVFDALTPGTQVFLSNLTVQNGKLSLPSGGAGVQNQAILDLQNLLILNNQISAPADLANQGGGIYNTGGLTVNSSIVQGNSAELGGGLSNVGTALLANSTLAQNQATVTGGGGIFNAGSDLTLVNSTLSGNTTLGFGGGLYDDASAQLFNSTLADNSANIDNDSTGDGGGIFLDIFSTGLSMTHTIVADNSVGTGALNPDCYTSSALILSGGYNWVETAGNCGGFVNTDITGEDPQLSPLANHGGETSTQALLPGSPAIDAGDPAGCQDLAGDLLTEDQRGSLRPVDGLGNGGTAICDIGATEYGADVAVTIADNPDPVEPEQVFSYNIQVVNNGPDSAENVVLTETLPSGISVLSITSVASCQQQGLAVTCSIGELASGKIVAVVIQAFAPDFETILLSEANVTSEAGDYNLANNKAGIETSVTEAIEEDGGCSLGQGRASPQWAHVLGVFGVLGLWAWRRRCLP